MHLQSGMKWMPIIKPQRAETPEDIIKAVPYIIRIAKAFGIPVLMKDGYEADDIIGTLAKHAEADGFEVYMMTSDKDYGQLVTDHVFIYKPSNKGNPPEILGCKEICAKWQIENVRQLIDILGLMGDAVDNIPGIPGVGEKTAIQLIKDFGSIENLLQNTDKLKGKLKEKVELNGNMATQSKQLATIICDVDLPFSLEDMKRSQPDKQALLDVLTELEFKTIAVRIMKDYFPGESVPSVESEKLKVESSTTEDLFSTPEIVAQKIPTNYVETQNFESLLHAERIGFYMAMNGGTCSGIGFSAKAGEACYISFSEHSEKKWEELKEILEKKSIKKIGYDIKQNLNYLSQHKITIEGELFDVMIAQFLIRPESPHYLPDIVQNTLGHHIPEFGAESRKTLKEQLSMDMVSHEQIMQACCERADMLFRLYDAMSPKLDEISVRKLFEEVEIPLESVLSEMEVEGIKVDKGALKEISNELTGDIEKLKTDIWKLAETEFNIDSPRQVGEILFDKLKITDKVKKTKTGQYSTGEEVLTELTGAHPIVDKILDYRELQKLKNTYVDALPLMVDSKTGRIHTTFNMVVAVTGRLSSDNPNLQNIPIRTERGREIRKAFVPANENMVLLSADYSQIELRIIASLSGDTAMIEAFQHNLDVHAATASRIYNVPLDAVTAEMRRNAKTVNFGIIYGISGFGLSQRLGIARKEATDIISQYFTQYPGIKKYMDTSIESARSKGYVETMLGRRRYLPDINSRNYAVRGFAERNAINAPIQGSAADMIKVAMIHIHNEMKKEKLRSKMVLQVHDELVFDVYPEELDALKPLVANKMKHALKLEVPIEVNMGVGKNWLEAH